jgi:enoyl-CoA hydratase/carnithine racemase
VALLEIDDRDGMAVVRMNRPPANALDASFMDAHLEVIATLRDGTPGAVVLTGPETSVAGWLSDETARASAAVLEGDRA